MVGWIVTVGATVYPAPGFVSNISCTEYASPILVVIATAVAFIPPDGAVEIETVGIPMYPLPSLFKMI